MKKFMIFLLMAFLYLGTCQARSEAAHPNDGKLKLLSWVTPTPSQSFLTPSGTEVSGDPENPVTFAVSIVGAESGCSNQATTLTAVVFGPVNASVTYLWYIDGEAAPGTNNQQTYEFIPANLSIFNDGQVHEFTVQVSPENCSMVQSPVHPFQLLKVQALITGPAVACANEDLTLVASLTPETSVPLQDVIAWQWFQGGSTYPYATTTENTITLPQSVIGNFNWHVEPVLESGLACVTPLPSGGHATWAITSVVIPQVSGTISLAEVTSPVCVGSQVTLSLTNGITATGITLGTPSYEWYMDGQLLATTTNTTLNTTLTEGTHFFYAKAIYDNYDCSDLQTAPISVTAVTAPALAITGNNVICSGQASNILTATDGFASYTWAKPATTPSTLGANKVEGTAPGVYSVTATSAAGCTSTADFTVYQFGGDLQVSASSYNVCPGETVVLNANYEGWTNSNITYTWSQTTTGTSTLNATSGSQVTATIPATGAAASYTYKVKAEVSTDCFIEYNVVVNVVSPTDVALNVTVGNSVCVGGQVTATASATSGSYTGLYDWYVNGVQVPGEHAASITMTFDQAGSYTFAAAPANTVCSSINPTEVTTSNTVTVYDIPEITITGDNVICQGASATLTATLITGASYTWAQPTASTAAAANNVLTTTVPGVYAVTASKNGCESTAEFTVIQLGGDLQVYASQLTACEGEVITLNANFDGYDNQEVGYTWTVSGTGATLNQTTGSTIALTMGSADAAVSVTATAPDATACTMSSNINIAKLNSTDHLTGVTASPQNLCQGALMTATAEGTGLTNVIWYVDGVEVPGQNLPNFAMNEFGVGEHTIAARDANVACGVGTLQTASVKPMVHAVPEITITGNNVICDGATTTLTATVVPSEGNTKVNWEGPVTATNTTTLNNATAGVYTATATNDYGCVATADFTVYQVGGSLELTADKMAVCPGEQVTLTATATGIENENILYTWSAGSEYNGMSSILVTPTDAAHTYTVSATGGECVLTATVNITINPLPTAVTVTGPTDNTLCAGEQATFEALPGLADLKYIWFQNGVQIPGENLNTITVNLNDPGQYSYAVMTVNQYGCHSGAGSEASTITGTGDYTYTTVHYEYEYTFDEFFTGTQYYYENGTETHTVPVTVTIALESLPSATVTVDAAPQVVITGNNVICNGAATTLTANVTPSGTYTYSWVGPKNGNEATLSADEPGVYNLTVTNNTTGCVATAQFTVEQFGADLQVNASAQDVCPGTTVMLNANLDGFNNENIVYTWSGDGIATGTHGSTIAVNPTATTTYTVVANTAAYTNCTMTSTITVNVINETTPSYTVTLNTPENICEGGMVSLSASNANLFYTWYVNGVAVEGENLPNVSLTLNDPGSYTFNAKAQGFECATTPLVEADKKVKVQAAPEVTITGENVICVGPTGATLTAHVTPSAPASGTYTYSWTGPGSVTGSNLTLNNATAGVYNFTVSNSVCSTTAEYTVYATGADLHVTADKMQLCEGEMVTLHADLDGFDNGNVIYSWTGTAITGTGATVTAVPTATDNVYKVTATSGNCSLEGSITLTVTPVTNVATTVTNNGSQVVCVGQQVDYFIASPYDYTYTWYIDGIEVPGQNSYFVVLTFDQIGYHYVSAKANVEGCMTSTVSSEVVVDVQGVPEVTISGNNFLCNGEDATLEAHANTPLFNIDNDSQAYYDGLYEYEWSEGTTTASMTTNLPGIYTVTVTNSANGCYATASAQVLTSGSDLQVVADKMQICEGESVMLNANLDGFVSNNITYTWSDGSNTYTGSTIMVAPTTTTTYTVTAAAVNGTSTTPICSANGQITITVNPMQAVTTTVTTEDPSAGSFQTTICLGQQVFFLRAASEIAGSTYTPSSYTWFMDGVELSDNALAEIEPNINEVGTHYFSARANVEGCMTSTESPEVHVYVRAIPEVTISGNNIVCNGQNAQLTAHATQLDPWHAYEQSDYSYTYTWSNGSTSQTMSTQTAGTYTVTATSTFGCFGTASIEVTTLGADLQVIADKMEMCAGEMVTLNANIDGFNSQNVSYTWSGNGLTTTSGSTVSAVPTTTGNVTYTVTASTGNCSVIRNIVVKVNDPVTYETEVEFAQWGYRRLCAGVENHFRATSTPNATNYVWYLDGVEIPGENLEHLTLTVTEHGLHYVAAKAVVDGCNISEVSDTLRFYIYDIPEITLTGNNVICDGDNAEITAAVVATQDQHWTEEFAYYWSNNSSANNATLTTNVPGIYTVTATNTYQDVNCHAVASIEVSTFGADLQVNADKMEICAGDMITLNADIDGFNNETVTYTWAGSGLVATTGSTVSAVPTATGNVTYTVTASTPNCSVVRTIVIKVNPITTLTTTIASYNSTDWGNEDDFYCVGQEAAFYVTSTPVADAYIWYVDGVEVPGETLPGYYFNANNEGIHEIVAKAVAGDCEVAELSNTVTFRVYPTPEVALTGNNIICNGADAVITADASNTLAYPSMNATYTYEWNDGTTGATLTTDEAGMYTVTVTNNHGCSTVASVNIYTTGSNLQVYADKMNVCEGEFVTLNANINGFVNENATYTWKKADGSVIGNASTVTVQAEANSSNQAVYTVTVNAGDCEVSGTITINVTPVQQVYTYVTKENTADENEDFCVGQQAINFAAHTNPANAATLYTWYVDGVEIPGANLSELEYNFDNAGTHYFAAKAIVEGCVNSHVSDEVHIFVFNAPEVTITGNNVICNGNDAVLTAQAMTPLNSPFYTQSSFTYTYQWSVPGETGQTLTVGTPGTYAVTVTNNRGCSSVASTDVVVFGSELQLTADKMNICAGEDVMLNAQMTGWDNEHVNYEWHLNQGDGPVIGSFVSSISVSPTVTTTYFVKVMPVVNGYFVDNGCVHYSHITINVEPLPAKVTLTQDRDVICQGGQVTITASGNADAYIWYQNGIEMEGEHQNVITVNLNELGQFSFAAKAVSENGCISAVASDPAIVNVVMNPTVQITGDPLICGADQYLNLYAVLNDTDPSLTYTYDWRLYNYTTSNGDNNYTSDSYYWNAYLNINNGNTSYHSYGEVNDPWFQIDMPNAQDYPYIFTVVVTTPEGCRVESEPYPVYVGEDPEVVVTVDYDEVCVNGEITATAHLGNWNMDNLTAQWQVRTYNETTNTWNDWTDINYGTSGILHHTPGVTSQYRIIVTQTTTGCTATSDPVTVNVVTPVAIDHIVAINANTNYPTTDVCEGAQIEVKAYVQTFDAAGNPVLDAQGHPTYHIDTTHTYMWKLNGMELQTIHGPEFSAQAYIYDDDPMYYVYEAYIVYDIPGCEPVPVASDTIHVKRNPIVTIDGNPNVCYYGPAVENVVLTAWVDGDVDLDATYTWYESGQSRPNPSGYDNNYRENWVPTYENPYIFTVEVTNGDGCTTISDPFYVNVYERPYTNITADATEICEGGNVTLQANLNNYNDPMLTFQWYKDEVNNTHIIPGATHEIETFEPALGATNYIVKVTHLMDFNTQYCVAYDTIRVDVNAIPTVTAAFIDLDATSICEGRSFNIGATVTGGVAGGEVYTWYRNGIVMEGFNGAILNDAPVAIDGEPTVYTYAVSVKQAASGCESVVYTLDPITVNPNPTIELVTDPIVCAEGMNNVKLEAHVTPLPTTPVQYKWMEDNTVVQITNDSIYYFTKSYRDYPYSFSVELANNYGCVSHADALVYVNAAPVVNITATETNICNGGEITLTATLADWNADQLTFQWFDGNDSIAGATELTYTVVPTVGPHAYHVEILQLTSECQATSNVINVTVNADPTVTINYAANQYTVCDGYQVDLTTTVTGGVTGGEVYTWYRNGQIIEGATSATYSEVVSALNGEPTTYNYAVSVAQAAAGCESNVYDALATITVNPNPVVALVTDPIVCDTTGNNITLTANMDPASVGSTVTFNWLEDNAIMASGTYTVVSNNQIKLHKAYRDYPYNFAVQVVNDYACSASSEAQVSVNANPIVNTTVTENNICVGGEITMALNLNDWNADQLTFQWYDNNVIIPGATSLSYTVVPELGNHEYFVKVFQLTSECEATSVPFTVTVNPDPVIDSVTASLYAVCNGAQLTITAYPQGGNVEGEVYTWYRNGILMPGATAATIMDTPGTIDNNIQQYVYTAVVTRPQAGCTSLPVSSTAVTVYPNPVVVITGDQHVCETDSVFLIANVDTTAFPVGSLHFTWYESGQIRDNMAYGLGDSRFYAEYMYPRTEPYIYTVNVEREDVEHACASMSAEFYVYVYPQPVVNVTASETMICTDGQVTLTANLNDYNADNLIYQWYEIRYHDVITAIGYNPDHTYIYDTANVAYRYYIPGATMPTYTTNLDTTTTLGVVVFQTNSTCWANDEVTITVNEIPVITNVLVNGVAVDTVCDGAQVTVTATYDANGSVGEPVFTWYRNGVLMEGVTGPIFSENVYTTDNHVTYNYYSVVVTLPASGCVSEMSSMAATVRINPAPSTVSISGINVLCENDSTTLTAYSDVEGEWTWSTGSHANTITVPAGVYTVTMKTVEGCEMTSEPFTVEAFGTDLLVSASATSICRGEHTTLYVNQDGWQGNVTYAWDAQAGNSTATTVDVQPDSTTTYHVTATVSSTNGSCTAEGEVTIIVHQLPAAFEVTASTNLICEGNQITFTAPVDPQVTGYIWYQNGIEIPGENQNVITINFNEAGTYTFAAKAISVEGCISAEASEPVAVTVTPAPSQVSITGVNVLCENDFTTLTAHSDVPGIFVWSTGDTATNVTVPAGSYNVTIITAEGCQLTSENFNVDAFGTDLLVSASATAICEGEHTTLYVDQEGWEGNVTYQWDAQAGNSTASTVDVQPTQTTTYHVTATVASTNGTCTAEGEVTIVVTPRPAQVTVAANKTTICEGNQITFTASGDAYSYIWYQNGVEIPGENQAVLTVNFNEAGNYSFAAKAVNDQNCESALASEPVTVTVNPAPAQVTITGINVLCENTMTTLTAQSDVTGIFVWNTGDTATTVTVPAGSYNVTMITPEGCQLTSENFNVTAFGTDILVSASATAICQGEHTTLYVDQDGWQGNVTYQWDAQAGNSTASTVDVQPDATTTYHVTATVSSTNGTCTAEGEVTIVVTPRPAQVTVAANTTTICEGNQITFTASGDAYSYIWYQNGVEIPGENQAVLTVNFNEAGSYSFAAKAVNDQNCESALASEPVTVTVNPAPSQVTITGTNVLCESTMTTLTAQSDVPGIFVWSTGDTAATITVPAGSYTVTRITAEGCQMTSENFNVVAFGTDLLVTATETNICEGEHTTLSVDQNGWQGNVTYLWSTGDSATTVDVQPAVTTTYTVTATVTSTNGICTATGEVTINVNPTPVTPIVYLPFDTVCNGEQVPVVIVNATDDHYYWFINGTEVPGENMSTLIYNTTQAGTVMFTARAVSDQGCVSQFSLPSSNFGNPALVVIDAPESVVITGNTSFCDGGSTTLYANVQTTAAPANITYTWFKDGVAINMISSDHITVTTSGSYKVIATVYGHCSTESMSVDVNVEQAPQLQLTATETTICAGGTTTITAEATGWNNANVNYNWSNGFQGSEYTFTPAIAGTYTFTVTASQATSGCVANDEITITVNEIPATPVVTVDNAVVCDGGQVTLTVTNANAAATYTWMRNGVVIAGATTATLTESPVTVDGDATNYVYTVIAELPISGCTSATSANTVVTVIPTPVVAVSVEGNTTLCAGGSTTLHANVTPANANYNYQWYKDNVLIDGATSADYTAAELARETAYNYSVVVTANAGCNVTAYAPAITFVADPVVAATISNNISCVGGTATLTAIVDGGIANVNGLNGYTFEWYRNNPTAGSQYSTTEFVANGAVITTPATDAPGNYTYWVTVTSNYGCQSTSETVNYSVIADPVVTITVATGYPQTVCNGGESMLKANVTGGYGETSYQWYKNGNLLVGETNQTLAINNLTNGVNDVYTVEVAQTGVGCSNSASANLNTLVTVAPDYTVNITGFGNVCEGGTLTLNATVNGVLNGDVLSYQWYRVSNGTATSIYGANAAQYETSELLLGDSYEYYVVVTSNISGCSVVSNSVPASVVAAPTVAIQGANTVCEGGDLTLNAFVTGGVEGAAYTYTWNWTGAANGSATTAVPTFVPTVPANDVATPYYFTVTISRNDNTGCTATSVAHEVNVLAVPTVSITADNNYICQNGDVTFTAHVSPVGAYNYVWTINGQQQAVNAATVTTTLATTGTITASVVVSAANASGSCSASATIAAPVQVVAAPTVTLAANHTTMCVGGVTTLTATVNANSNIPANFNYEWMVDGTPVAGLTNTLNQTLTTAGVHHYQVRVSQDNNLGCASAWSNQATVQVAEQPVVTLSSEDGLAICEGGSITLTGVVTNYGNTVNGVTNSDIYGNLVFDWTSNGVNVHHNTSNNAMNQVTETLNTIGNYTYQVSVTPAGYNCQPQVSNEYTVNVVGNPTWTDVHVYSNNGTDACLGEMVYLMAGIQGGVSDDAASTNGHIQWVVTDENGNTVNVNGGLGGTSYDIPTIAGTYIYTPTFVGNIGSGCQLTNTNDVQVAVTVHELPTAEFISGDGTALCANDPSASAELVISFTGVAPFTYEVVDGAGNIIAHATTMANTATIYVSPDHQTTYRINLISDNYCENPAVGDATVVTVYVNDVEFVNNTFDAECDNNEVTISFNMISGNPAAAFTVVYENGLQASGTISNNTATFATPTVPGAYSAVFTVDGCSYDIVVRVPMAGYSYTGTLPIMDQRWNDVVVVNCDPNTNGGHVFVGFQWYHNGVAIPGATYSNYQDKAGLNGFYSVELTEQDANGNMITYMVCEQYFDATSGVKVYPVPANVRQEITIELDLTSEELDGAVLDIYSVTGAHISHVTDLQPITKIEGFKAQGTYFGRILTGTNDIKTVKFIIVK